MVKRFKVTALEYALHKHTAVWMNNRMKELLLRLPKGSIASEWDFAENYSVSE